MQLINEIRERLGFAPFIKIDPNTQQITETEASDYNQKLGQAVTCAVLAGIYKYTRSEEGFQHLLNRDKNLPWSTILFGHDEDWLVTRIADYANWEKTDVRNELQDAGDIVWQTAEHHLQDRFSFESVGNFFNNMRNDILHYLPPALQLGKILNDNSIDDRTNKMEGPVSSMMHGIEKLFSQPQKLERVE